MDYGKFRYEQQKKAKIASKKQKTTKLKGVRFRANIAARDLEIRVNKARSFLEAGDKVKFTGLFRGRQFAHTDLVREQMKQISEQLKDVAAIEKYPSMEGRIMTMVMAPLKSKSDKERSSALKAKQAEGESKSGKNESKDA